MQTKITLAVVAAAAILLTACGTTDSGASAQGEPMEMDASEATMPDPADYAKDGFLVEIDDGRLWVRRPDQAKDDKCVTWIAAGPDGMTLRAPDADTALLYLAQKPGFHVEIEDGRIWVLREGQQRDERSVTRIGVGPRGATVKAVDRETLDAYLGA